MTSDDKKLKIAFLTAFDPHDRRSWSGVVYYVAQALQKHCGEVAYIGPIHTWEQLAGRILNKVSQLLTGKKFPYYISFLLAKKYARIAARRLARGSFDLVVAPAGATITAFLQTDVPVVLVEDATFALLHNYHAQFSNLLEGSIDEANSIMQMALEKASLLLFSSAWAARSALEHYYAEREKVHVVPFGANFDETPSRRIAEARQKTAHCKLLFVGLNWERKGGAIAFETLLRLEELGIQAELTICGCTPPRAFSHPRMAVVPFLDKNDPHQRQELEKFYMSSDFLLLPTRYDSSPIVFCEANAFGLPVITTDTAGVMEMVRNGENGYVLPESARGTEYAEVIARAYRDDQLYARLVRSSREAFENRMNWDTWGACVKEILTEFLSQQAASAYSHQLQNKRLKQELISNPVSDPGLLEMVE